MSKLFLFKMHLIVLLLSCISNFANASPVEYIFAGNLTGLTQAQVQTDPNNPLSPLFTPAIKLTDVPFQVSIQGDTSNISTGYSLVYNNSTSASWTLQGFGSSFASDSQVFNCYCAGFSGNVGFSWGGQTFQSSPSQIPSGLTFSFSGNPPNNSSFYPFMYSDVPPISITLATNLANPSAIPKYSTSVLFSSIGAVTLTSFSNVTYSVVPQPVPEADASAMMLMGLGIMGFMVKRRKK